MRWWGPGHPMLSSASSAGAAAGMGMGVGGGGYPPPQRGAAAVFTAAQWAELEQQALIYKYLMAGVPVPPDLLLPVRPSPHSAAAAFSFAGPAATSPFYHHHPSRELTLASSALLFSALLCSVLNSILYYGRLLLLSYISRNLAEMYACLLG